MPPSVKRRRIDEPESHAGTIQYTVKNISKLAVDYENDSQIVNVGGFPWQLTMKKEKDEDDEDELNLGIFLHCLYEDSNVWFCNCDATITLINQDDPSKSTKDSFTNRYDSSKGSGYGFPRIHEWNKLLDDGFIKDDSVTILVEFTVKSCSGKSFRLKLDHDFFSPSPKSDVVLIVEKKEFHVCKQLLAIHSLYFDSLFNRNFKEKQEPKIKLENVSSEEFENLLRVVYRLDVDEPFTEENVEGIIKLCEMWNFTSILDEVEKHLITSDSPKLELKLQLAGNYGLHTLFEICISSLTTCQMILDLKQTEEYADFSGETKETLFQLFTQLCKCTKGKPS